MGPANEPLRAVTFQVHESVKICGQGGVVLGEGLAWGWLLHLRRSLPFFLVVSECKVEMVLH